MTDTAISLVEFCGSFHAKAMADLPDHPFGADQVCRWLQDLRAAVYADQPTEAARLMAMVTRKIEQEREWDAETLRSIEELRRGRQ